MTKVKLPFLFENHRKFFTQNFKNIELILMNEIYNKYNKIFYSKMFDFAKEHNINMKYSYKEILKEIKEYDNFRDINMNI
jgi:hypothetical protein